MGNGVKPHCGSDCDYCCLNYRPSFFQRNQKQIEAVYNLLDVFVAAQNPTMVEAKRKYELQLADLDKQIQCLNEDIQTFSPFFGRGSKVEDMDELFKKNEQCK